VSVTLHAQHAVLLSTNIGAAEGTHGQMTVGPFSQTAHFGLFFSSRASRSRRVRGSGSFRIGRRRWGGEDWWVHHYEWFSVPPRPPFEVC
jgi:hypothetical protein